MSSQILIQAEPPEIRVAEVRDGRLFDFEIERAGRVLGDIYRGRVENVLPGMDAAFIDIGLQRNALIYVGDVGDISTSRGADTSAKKPSINHLLHTNDELTVQVARPPSGSKGARVTTKLSLPGRYVILLTQTDNIGVSKRIESDKERSRLRQIVAKLRPMGHGLIVRTEAAGITEAELQRDIQSLCQQLQRVKERAEQMTAPALLHRESNLLERVARDKLSDDVQAVWIDNAETFHLFRDMAHLAAPRLADRVLLYEGPVPLFDKFNITNAIALAGRRVVELPRGGSISVDETEALVAIDVNTGRFTGKNQLAETVLQTNLEAVEEIARQLRVRNLGGVIAIDFIDMPRTRDRIKVFNALEAALKQDRTQTRIVNISPSGLVEMTRRREGRSLRQMLRENCFYCHGEGVVDRASTVALNARRRIRALSHQPENRRFEVTLHPEAACALLGPSEEFIQNLEKTASVEVIVRVDPTLHIEASEIVVLPSSRTLPPAGEERPYLAVPTPLYPRQQPQFIVFKQRLIKLATDSETLAREAKEGLLPAAALRITGDGRWFRDAEIIAFGSPAP